MRDHRHNQENAIVLEESWGERRPGVIFSFFFWKFSAA
jgi:hypothetical protein